MPRHFGPDGIPAWTGVLLRPTGADLKIERKSEDSIRDFEDTESNTGYTRAD